MSRLCAGFTIRKKEGYLRSNLLTKVKQSEFVEVRMCLGSEEGFEAAKEAGNKEATLKASRVSSLEDVSSMRELEVATLDEMALMVREASRSLPAP